MPRTNQASSCQGFEQTEVTRRRLLQVGGIGLLGLGLPTWLRAAEQTTTTRVRAKSVIFLHQFGGPSQLDTLDMKPSEPEGIRGELKPIATRSPDIQVSELLPRLAQVADKFALIRSMHHRMKNNNSATYYSLTGHAPPVDDI